MKGQWLGTYSGNRSGLITLNLDESPEYFSGYAHLMDETGQAPITMAVLRSKGKSNPFEFGAITFNVDPETHVVLTPEILGRAFPGMTFPKQAVVKGHMSGRTLDLEWTTDIGTSGTAKLSGGTCDDTSDYVPTELTWAEFKNKITEYQPRRFIFRGQEKPWKLRTSFHRHGRSDVFEFMRNDIPALHRVLSSRTKHIYNLNDADQNGAFWHLAQHHGYPTPLLDWSYSPFVAAFCAYRKIAPQQTKPDDKVRIFVFNHTKFHSEGHWERIQTLRTHKLHISVLDFIAIDNERVIPQQALSCVTNVDDVEAYIREREKLRDTVYLEVFDLPASERSVAMSDLSVMGITAGSMFPGLDGMCEELKARMFNS